VTLRLADHWVWDSWLVDDGVDYHLFFLRASRALHDPYRRHLRASIGHAMSTDLRDWTLLPDALVHADTPAWDDLATWTGSVAQGPDGRWHLFYTGLSHAEHGLVQRIGVAISDDLLTWQRSDGLLLESDPRWYEKLDRDAWFEEVWRDPYVFADPDGDGWHMIITARVPQGRAIARGVIGHARSDDLLSWEVQPPLSEPSGFGHLEVPQVCMVDDQPVLVFSCWSAQADHGGQPSSAGGVYVVPGKTLLGPWDISAAKPLNHPSLYAGRLVWDRRSERWAVIGFRDIEDGRFIGSIVDPIPVTLDEGQVRIVTPPRSTGATMHHTPAVVHKA
jgi:beta-fructofuranosidase